MALAVIVALISLPIVEIVLLIKIGGTIGVLPLLALLVGMAIAGGWLLRRQGIAASRRAMEQMARNEPPVQSVVDGIGLMTAGVLMLIPGLLTDVAGLLLLVPAIRRPLIGRLIGAGGLRWSTRSAGAPRGPGTGDGRPGDSGPFERPKAQSRSGSEQVIEGEFQRLEERTIRPGSTRPPG